MRFFKKKMTRAEAIAKAIDASAPGDTVEIHNNECFPLTMCVCDSKTLIIAGGNSTPIGFRMTNE